MRQYEGLPALDIGKSSPKFSVLSETCMHPMLRSFSYNYSGKCDNEYQNDHAQMSKYSVEPPVYVS